MFEAVPGMSGTQRVVVAPDALDRLVGALRSRGYRVLGPTVRDGAIIYDDLESAAQLPVGRTDRQDGGSHRLERRADEARFGYAVGPHSWKRFLFPPRVRLRRARRNGDGAPAIEEEELDETPSPSSASVRASCTRSRSRIASSSAADTSTATTPPGREGAFLVAVNCFEPGDKSFCTSMGTGPKVESGYDLALTELLDGEHRLLVEAGSERGADVPVELAARPSPPTWPSPQRRSRQQPDGWAGRFETFDIRGLLAEPRASPLGRRRRALPHLRQLHPRLPHLLLLGSRGPDGSRGRGGGALARLGQLLLGRLLVHPRRQRPALGTLALPAVADAQARHVVDQFGTSGVRRLRPLHHLRPVGIDITEEVAAIRATEEDSAAVA